MRPAAKAAAQQSARKTKRKKHCGGEGGHARPASRRPLLRCRYRVFLKMGHQKCKRDIVPVLSTAQLLARRRASAVWQHPRRPPWRKEVTDGGRPAGRPPGTNGSDGAMCIQPPPAPQGGTAAASATATAAACTSPLRFMDGKNWDFLQPR